MVKTRVRSISPPTLIPLVRPLLPDFDAVTSLLYSKKESSTWSNFGELHEEASGRLSGMTGRHVLPVTNGTVAIRLALQTMLPVGKRVALPDFTHIGTLNAVISAHMRPVLLPANPKTWQIDPMALERHKKEYDAFIVVSPFGNRVDTRFYDTLAASLKRSCMYDFAAAWGQFPRTPWPVTYSFHATKNFSCGEGGVTTFAHQDQFARARRTMNFGILPDRSVETPLADNMKIDEIRSAVILAHLLNYEAIEDRLERKRETLAYYSENLSQWLRTPDPSPRGFPSLCVLSGFQNADAAERKLIDLGITARRYYPLMSDMPGLKNITRFGKNPQELKTTLALPSDVSKQERAVVCQRVLEVLKG